MPPEDGGGIFHIIPWLSILDPSSPGKKIGERHHKCKEKRRDRKKGCDSEFTALEKCMKNGIYFYYKYKSSDLISFKTSPSRIQNAFS